MHTDTALEKRHAFRIILPPETSIGELERLTNRFANDEHFDEGYYLEMLPNGLPMIVVRAEADLCCRITDALALEFPPTFYFRDASLALCAEGPGEFPIRVSEGFVKEVVQRIEQSAGILLPLQFTVVLSPVTYH